jgi:RNA polymerase sigma-70 factor (ECF subfamily)
VEPRDESIPPSGTNEPADDSTDPASRWVELYADVLFRQALLRLGHVEDAQDVVQETLLAAMRGVRDRVRVHSEKAWLLGIMKHKVLDQLRRRYRQPSTLAGDDLEKLEQAQFESGEGVAHWHAKAAPRNWADPERRLEQGEFAAALRVCLRRLPDRHARAFILRELDGVETDRLCAELNLSAGNLFVMLHRARLALRRCLELSGLRPESNET